MFKFTVKVFDFSTLANMKNDLIKKKLLIKLNMLQVVEYI